VQYADSTNLEEAAGLCRSSGVVLLVATFFAGVAPKLHPRLRSLPYLTAFSYSRLSRTDLLKHFIADKNAIIFTRKFFEVFSEFPIEPESS